MDNHSFVILLLLLSCSGRTGPVLRESPTEHRGGAAHEQRAGHGSDRVKGRATKEPHRAHQLRPAANTGQLLLLLLLLLVLGRVL